MTEQAPPGKPARWWFGRIAAAVIVIVLVVAGMRLWTTSVPQVSQRVDDEWNATIRRLGIEPIYPPQEDITVGDIYLVVTEDENTKLPASLQGRAIKLWHVDMTQAINDAYKEVYVFPDTIPRPKDEGAIWEQKAAESTLFGTGIERQKLPIVLFPGFTFAQIRRGNVSGGWLSSFFDINAGVSGDGEQSVELRIPSAETYGVASLVATAYLDQFCNDERSRPVCTEEGARRQLSMVVGQPIFKTGPDPKDPEKERYLFNVEIALISRVFLTRSIETVTRSSSAIGAQAKIAIQLNEELQKLKSSAVTAEAGATDPKSTADLREKATEIQNQLQKLVNELSGAGTGGSISASAAESNRIAITQTLQRPVAIGFRAARRTLFEK